MIAGHVGVTVTLVIADDKAVAQVRDWLGEGVVGVAVKEGYTTFSAIHLHPAGAQRRIREGAEVAVRRSAEAQPWRLPADCRAELDFDHLAQAQACLFIPRARRSAPPCGVGHAPFTPGSLRSRKWLRDRNRLQEQRMAHRARKSAGSPTANGFLRVPFAKSHVLTLCLALAGASTGSNGGQLYAGMYPDDFWRNTEILNSVATWAGKPMTFGGTFVDAGDDAGNIDVKLEQAWQARSTPFVNVEVGGTAAEVAEGEFDDDLNNFARGIAAWLDRGEGRSLIVAPMQEMNLRETRWGCDPESYQASFRKFVAAFGQLGVDDDTRVRWAFAPNGWTSPACGSIAPYYPGDELVDLIGISAYNFGPNEWDGKNRAPAEVYVSLDQLRAFAPDKPYLIAQTGTAPVGGDRDAWLREMFDVLTADPNVVGFLYFNKDKSSWGGNEWDWRIFDEAARTGAAGFVEGMQRPSTVHRWPLVSWFQPGPLPMNPEF